MVGCTYQHYAGITDTLQPYGTPRRVERLVEEIVPDFVGADDLPLSGRDEQWGMVTEYRVRLSMESHDWIEAERLQRVSVEWDRRNAVSLLTRPAESLSNNEKNIIRSLATSLNVLADILRNQNSPECTKPNEEAYDILINSKDSASAAVVAFNLGHAYKDLPALWNLDEAERWYRRSLELRAEGDRIGRGIGLDSLGSISYEKFKETRNVEFLNVALDYYHQAINMFPAEAVNNLAVSHNQLGVIYDEAGNLERALYHYNQDIHYDELAGNIYSAGQTRFNVAITLANNGRPSDALRNFESYQGRAKDMEDKTKGLIERIEGKMKG